MERPRPAPQTDAFAADVNLADGVLAHARDQPDRPALEFAGRTVTYGLLGRRVAAMAAGLQKSGYAPGVRMALVATDVETTAVGLLGAALAGLIVVPIAPDTPAEERDRLHADLSIADTLGERNVPLLVEQGMGAPVVRPAGGDAPVTVMLSSGTTGQAKAIEFSHRRQLWLLRAINAALGASSANRYFALVEPTFAFGRNPMLRVLDAGGTVVAEPLSGLGHFFQLMGAKAITDLSATPRHVREMLAEWRGNGPALPGIERLLVSTAFLHHAERLEALRRISPRLHVCLGMNEAGFVTIARPEDVARVPDTVGKAMPGVAVGVVNESGQPLPPGEIGELRVAAPCIPEGYLGASETTRHHFRQGWFHPGDLATLDAEGFVHLHGRVDDRINRSGLKIYPIEIERVLRAHPAVVDAAAIGMPARQSGEVPVAAVVLSTPVAAQTLLRWSRERLPQGKAPIRVFALDALPRNAMGKVPSAELRRILLARLADDPKAGE